MGWSSHSSLLSSSVVTFRDLQGQPRWPCGRQGGERPRVEASGLRSPGDRVTPRGPTWSPGSWSQHACDTGEPREPGPALRRLLPPGRRSTLGRRSPSPSSWTSSAWPTSGAATASPGREWAARAGRGGHLPTPHLSTLSAHPRLLARTQESPGQPDEVAHALPPACRHGPAEGPTPSPAPVLPRALWAWPGYAFPFPGLSFSLSGDGSQRPHEVAFA